MSIFKIHEQEELSPITGNEWILVDAGSKYNSVQLKNIVSGNAKYIQMDDNFTAVANEAYRVNAGVEVTLPTGPVDNTHIFFLPGDDSMVNDNSTIKRPSVTSPPKIAGDDANFTWDVHYAFALVYVAAANDWQLIL